MWPFCTCLECFVTHDLILKHCALFATNSQPNRQEVSLPHWIFLHVMPGDTFWYWIKKNLLRPWRFEQRSTRSNSHINYFHKFWALISINLKTAGTIRISMKSSSIPCLKHAYWCSFYLTNWEIPNLCDKMADIYWWCHRQQSTQMFEISIFLTTQFI